MCSDCTYGMPRWWVNEPYISLCMADTPLSYTMSSGQEMAFQFYYAQRTRMPDASAIAAHNNNSLDSYSFPGQATGYGPGSDCGTNASWGNNWTMSIQIWDSQWEAGWNSTYGWHWTPLDYFAPYSQGYQALVWRPEGSKNYFNVIAGSQSATDPQRLVQIQAVSADGNPVVYTHYSSPNVNSNTPTADASGIFWGDAGVGVKLVNPDGSQDVFGLSAYPTFVPNTNIVHGTTYVSTGITSTRLLLTQRIDPQGRATLIGYELCPATNGIFAFYRVRYVVDPDGRTNSFFYNSNNAGAGGFQVKEIDDPYGRKATLTYSNLYSHMVVPASITDAAGLTNSFSYQGTNGWISTLSTPYGTTSFSYYDLPDPSPIAPDCYIQRAIYIHEPAGAQQLNCYIHNNSNVAGTGTAPTISGQSFDDGTSGSTGHSALTYRNTYHWGRRQFAALSSTVQTDLSSGGSGLSQAISDLTAADFNKARMRHWLMASSDDLSITESLSSERDPSPDAAGNIPGLRTWYNYAGKPSAELLGSSQQPSCVARLLPDSTSQYTTYNYYTLLGPYPPAGAGMVSDNESSYTKPDGSIGLLTNWFHYAANSVDLISVSNSAGQYVNYGYNSSHQITSATNALNQVTTFNWDEYYTWNLLGVQLPAGKSISLSYYSSATPPTATSSMLQQISLSPEGRTFTINNYSAGLPSNVTDDRGLTVTNTWDGLNRLTSTAFPGGTTLSNLYYRLDLVGTKDRQGNWTRYAYDGLQHLTAVTNANNAVTSYSWCGCGSLTAILGALTNLTTLNYDNQGNLTNAVFPDYSSVTWQFDLARRMTNAFDGTGRNAQIAYNIQGLPVNIANANGTSRAATYDGLGRPISETDANGVTVTNSFDALSQLLKRTWPGGISESYGYSPAGLIAYTNRDGKSTLYGRDGAGRLTAVTNANTEVTQFAYDSLDNVVSLIDGLQHQTTWQYNEYGWLTNKVDGLTRPAFRYAYNTNGWVTNRWTPEKGNTGYTYDNAGNVTAITYPQRTNTYAYDALNRLTNMVDAIGTHVFGYTAASLLQSENGPWTNDTVSYAYAQGLRTALTLAQTGTNWSQSYGYDSAWRMTNLASPAGTFVYSYNFLPASTLVSSIALPNGASITNGYDSLGRLTQTVLNNYWGYTLDGYGYTPDSLGLRTNIVRNLGLTNSTVKAGFDNIGQLTSWTAKEPNGIPRLNEQLSWAYDAAHNLQTRNNGNLAQTFTTDAANQLTGVGRTGTFTLSGAMPAPATNLTVNGQPAQICSDFTFARTNLSLANGANSFTSIAQNVYGLAVTNTLIINLPTSVSLAYDNNGNLTNDSTRTFAYDSENQLTNVTLAGIWRSDFVYDGLNRRRIERDFAWQGGAWIQTNETHYIYDGALILQERDASNHVLVTYTRGLDLGGGVHTAGGIGGLLARTDTNSSTFYHSDGSGNITALMDTRQNIVARYMYNPFGQLVGRWGSLADANEMQFSSMPFYSKSGIVGYGRRFYSANLQRWLNQDPIQEWGGINTYQFVGNNTLHHIDPYGLDFWQSGAYNNWGWPGNSTQAAAQGVINAYNAFNTPLGGPTQINAPQAQMLDQENFAVMTIQLGMVMQPPNATMLNKQVVQEEEQIVQQLEQQQMVGPQGSLNPATKIASSCGSKLHADRPGNLPDQLRNRYPETHFKFTPPGVAGPDVQVAGGMHPSFMGDWPEGVDFGDFKPDTAGGFKTFNSDSRNKWNVPVKMITYDPATGKLTTQ